MGSRIEQLMELCMQEKASEEERRELLRLLQIAENEEETKSLIRAALENGVGTEDMGEDVSDAVLEAIFQADAGSDEQKELPNRRKLFSMWMATAAAAVLLLFAGLVFYSKRKEAPAVLGPRKQEVVRQIVPGCNKAILTLADNTQISLDDARKGDIARDGNAQIVKAGDSGRLVYSAMAGNKEWVAYNTITTPRGGQYQLDLSDGSRVWLNSSSSLHFPTTFTGAERTVEFSGEGYFEIARNTAHPFSIIVNGVRVQVLGTRFNINAYQDEAVMRTTLIEGSVKVVTAKQALLLAPGQQAMAGESLKLGPDADLEEVMAWKNGIFNFKDLDIQTIMRQISRWYDVDVVYEGKKPEGHFSGMISRNTPVQTVLKMLEYEGVRFTIAANKIVIGNQ